MLTSARTRSEVKVKGTQATERTRYGHQSNITCAIDWLRLTRQRSCALNRHVHVGPSDFDRFKFVGYTLPCYGLDIVRARKIQYIKMREIITMATHVHTP